MCFRHGAKRELCSNEGCSNQVINGGVCIRHGAKVKLCNNEGCTSQAQNGKVCIRYRATWSKKLCSNEGCTNYAVKGGVCIRHGVKKKNAAMKGAQIKQRKECACIIHGAKIQPERIRQCSIVAAVSPNQALPPRRQHYPLEVITSTR